jgi:hypothetical protein|tara:strand:- start:1177 stop:1335 length:159 start_codon:yes stop_codon:yes gene_type:complete
MLVFDASLHHEKPQHLLSLTVIAENKMKVRGILLTANQHNQTTDYAGFALIT